MFQIVIVALAIGSDWHDTYAVNPEYPSFELCEAARPDVADDFRQFLERRHLRKVTVNSTCVKSDSDV